MPKPVTSLPVWAANANYLTGPLVGSPTKVPIPAGVANDGHRPGVTAPTAAELWNDWLNQLSTWIAWLESGTPTPGVAAALLETDATGQLDLARLNLGGEASGISPLVVNENSGAPSTAASITNSLGGFALLGSNSGGASAAIRGITTGSGPGVEALNLGTGNGLDVRGSNTVATRGVDVDAGTDTFGVFVDANGGTLTVGLRVEVDDGAPCQLVKTNAGLHPTLFLSGHGAPARANLNLSDQANPSTAVAGDVWSDHGLNNFGRGSLRHRVEDGVDGGGAIGVRQLWDTVNGIGHVLDSTGSTGGIVAGFTQVAIASLDTSEVTPGKPVGKYIIWWSFSVESTDAADLWDAELRINGTPVQEDSGDFIAVTTETRGGGCYIHTAAGSTLYTVTIFVRRFSGAGTLTVDEATIAMLGAFELTA